MAKKKKKNKWLDLSAFDDGYDFGDITKTIKNSAKKTSKTLQNNASKSAKSKSKNKSGGTTKKSSSKKTTTTKKTTSSKKSTVKKNDNVINTLPRFSTKRDFDKPDFLSFLDLKREENNVKTLLNNGQEKRSYFQSGLFEDGYDFGDITKTILGTTKDIKSDIGTGVARIGEAVVDTGAYAVGGVAKALGKEEFAEKTKKFIARDLVDEFDVGEKLGTYIGPSGMVMTAFDKMLNKGKTEEASVLGEKSDSLVQSAGQLGGTVGLQMVGVPWWVTTGVTGFGAGTQEAFNEGATYGEAGIYGGITAGSEVAFEKLGGIKFGGKALDTGLKKQLSKAVSNKVAKNLVKFGIDAGAEGTEEVLTEITQNIGRGITYEDEKTMQELLTSEEAMDNYIEAFIGGAVMGGGFNAGKLIQSSQTGRDYDTGLTDNEQKVVNKEIENRTAEKQKKAAVETEIDRVISERTKHLGTLDEKAKKNIREEIQAKLDNGELDYTTTKLSKKERTEIEKQVEEDLKLGYIGIDTIESTLSGEKTSRINELRELLSKTTKDSEKSAIETELRQLEGARAEEMKGLLGKDFILQESYRQEALKGEEFTRETTDKDSDITKELIESAKFAGMNNTRRMHDLFEYTNKIANDTGTKYGFVNNEQLKQLGHEVEGKTINGLVRVNEDGTSKILINVDSNKAINTIIGHETTHLLEGTAEHKKLVDIVKEYATTKGDYDTRLKEFQSLYQGVNADIENEITADLVGDYLFTDETFITNLSVKEPNVFQKVYDYIKHVYKMATAGSTEKRQLEQVKRRFDKAYKQMSKTVTQETKANSLTEADSNTKFSLEDIKNKYKDDTDYLFLYENDSTVTISNMVVKEGRRNKGVGQSILDDVTSYADENGKTIVLTPTSEFGTKGKLTKWYKSNGFVENKGKNTDFTIRDTMYRLPSEKTVKFSISDSNGRELSKAQQEYFKDSKVRDDNGNLKVMYHGTSKGGHTVFEPFGESRFGLFGAGTYFTDNKSIAESYTEKGRGNNKQVYETYLNIKNPMDMDAPGDYNAWKYYFADADYPAEGTNEQFFKAMVEVFRDEQYPTWEAKDTAMDVIQSMGYDGITHVGGGRVNKADSTRHRVYIAFEPEQIKNIDNTNPTSNPDIRFSLTDNLGNRLSPAVQKRFENSKVRDEDGDLKVVYHGTPAGEFFIFDKAKGSAEGDFGSGFYFSDNEADMEANYEGGGPDFDNKVARRAEQIEAEEEIDYEEAEARAREELYKGDHRFEVYLNIENPAIVGETYLLNEDSFDPGYDMDDFDSEDDYYAEVEQHIADEIDGLILDIERNVELYNTNGLSEVIWEAYYEGGIGIEDLKAKVNELYLEDEYGNIMGNEVVRQIIESLGYDGIIDPTVSTKFRNMGIEPGTTHYIVFKPNQIKNITNENPTDNPDVRYSISEDDIAPVKRETGRALTEADLPFLEQQRDEAFRNITEDYAPVDEDDYYTEDIAPVNVEDPFKDRDIDEVGNRKVKAYMYENPEVKPFFQEEAGYMLTDLQNSVKGEKFYNDKLYYESSGEQGFFGTKRQTTDDIAYLLDSFKYTYADIEKGLKAIIEDHGEENNAISKRIEFALNDRLMDGYEAVDGTPIPANDDYRALIENMQIQAYSEANYNEWVKSFAGMEAPAEDVSERKVVKKNVAESKPVEDIAPAREDARDPYVEFLKQQTAENIKAYTEESNKPKGPVFKSNEISPKKKKKHGIGSAWDTVQTLMVNRNRQQDKLAKQTGNKEIKFKGDRVNNIAGEIGGDIFTAQTDNYGNAIGKPLDAPFEQARKNKLDREFDDYLKHQSNIERHRQGKGSVVPAETSQQYVEAYEQAYPKFKEWAKDVYTYNQNLLDNAVKNGLYGNGFREYLVHTYGHYVPFFAEESLQPSVELDPDEIRSGRPIRRAIGGADVTLQGVEQAMMKQTYSYMNAIAKNDLYKEIVQSLGGAGVIPDMRTGEPTDLTNMLYEDESGKYLTAFINGEAHSVNISEELYTELKRDLDTQIRDVEEKLGIITKPLQKVSQLRGKLLTTYNPSFILTNPIKDFQDALLNSKHTMRYIKNLDSAILDSRKAESVDWYAEQFKEQTGQDINTVTDVENLSGRAKRLYKSWLKGTTWNRFMTSYGNNATQLEYADDVDIDIKKSSRKAKNKGFLNKLGNANNFMEVMFRYPEFKATLEKGKSFTEALYNAREVTTNFGRGGTISKAINRNGATFFNTSVQGMDKFFRNFSMENGAKGFISTVSKSIVLGMLPAIANHVLLGGGYDDEYEALPDYVKSNYYLFRRGNGEFIRIPKGRMISVLGSAARMNLEASMGDVDPAVEKEVDNKAFLENAWSQIGASNPLKENILAPVMQAHQNEAWYGDKLVPTRLEKLPVAEQYDASTDEFSKWLGEKLDVSPYKVNYVLDQYSGGIGDMVLPMITPEATSGAEGKELLLAPIRDKFVVNSVDDNRYIGELFDLSDELKVMTNSSEATLDDVMNYEYISDIASQMGELYALKREIQADETLSKSEKYAEVRKVQELINDLASEGIKNYNTGASLEIAYEEHPDALVSLAYDDYNTYNTHRKALWNFKADKDKNGKSIRGTKQAKILDYLNESDLDYGERIILFRQQYPSNDQYNQDIVDYLNSRDDISYEEMESILKALDFKVYSDGTVTW